MRILATAMVISTLVLTSCGGDSPESMATKICECGMEAGLSGAMKGDRMGFGDLMGRGAPECAKDLAMDLKEALDGKSKEEKAEYMRDLLKALLDTDCGTMGLKLIPYDELIDGMSDGPRGGGDMDDLICECVQQSIQGGDMSDECEDLQDEMQERVDAMSEDEREDFMKLVEECADAVDDTWEEEEYEEPISVEEEMPYPNLCDCIYEEQEDIMDQECEDYLEDWRARYEMAEGEELDDMDLELLDCDYWDGSPD